MDGAATDYAIDVKGLNKSFGDKQVVKDFAIQVPRGRITGFLGPNGSGKTTTLRMLCGLLTPGSGEGTCLGYDIIRQADAIKRRVGYMTQKFSLYEDLTIEENLLFMARVHGLDRRHARVSEALENLGLLERRKQLAGKLSGGWKQRLALAATTLHQPDLLLLDEPTAGMSRHDTNTTIDLLKKIKARGMTKVIIEHDMHVVFSLADRISVLSGGRIIAEGAPDEIRGSEKVQEAYLGGAHRLEAH